VPAQVEAGEGGPGECPGGLFDQVIVPGKGEDGAVVVGVLMRIEQGRTGRSGQVVEHRPVSAFADVDHALEEHGASVARATVESQQLPGGSGPT
jgi:hypothetical protein